MVCLQEDPKNLKEVISLYCIGRFVTNLGHPDHLQSLTLSAISPHDLDVQNQHIFHIKLFFIPRILKWEIKYRTTYMYVFGVVKGAIR